MKTTHRPSTSATPQHSVTDLAPKSGRETIELLVELIRTASSKKQYQKLIEPADRLLSTHAHGYFSGFKQRAVAKPKETLLSLSNVLTRFLEDTELTHYLTSELNLSSPEAQEIESKVSKITKRRL